MTVSYCFFIKTQHSEEEIKEELNKCWFGSNYDVSVIRDEPYIVVFLERAYGLPGEKAMAEKSIDYLFKSSIDKRMLYSRCDDPYFLSEPIKKIRKEDIFTKEYAPSYNVSKNYLYEIENL